MNKTLALVALATGLVVAGGASAQSTWNLVSGSGCGATAQAFGNSVSCTGSGNAGTSATLTGWSNDRGANTNNFLAGTGWANAYISPQGGSGYGVASRTEGINVSSPDHSVDSIAPGTYDFVMVQFNTTVILDKFRMGWGATDSDVTLMRWTGNAAPTINSGNLTNTISAGGWQLVNSYADTCKNSTGGLAANASCNATTSLTSTGATIGSSYWLISAYNTTMDNKGWTAGNDGFKLNFLETRAFTCPSGTPTVGGNCGGGGGGGGSVPEPGSLALAAAGLLGAFGIRRRVTKKAA